ncbi:ornithine cyclodeaminase family protein [Bacillus sp. Hm123]|uniref:ornithine cyclodeaminase family protein n=1 Tax=Bacillus sp. Hm123 TaxID=3450745 RepID=UPI003F426F3A
MLIISEKDMSDTICIGEMIDSIEHAYHLYEQQAFQMNTRTHISLNSNTFLLMPCVANHFLGTKIVSVFPNNQNLPVTQGVMLLADRETGETKAMLNGTLLTNLRTGAIGGAAIRHLAAPYAHSVGLIGTGVQGLYQLLATCHERDIQDIYLYNRTPKKTAVFSKDLKQRIAPHIRIHTENKLDKVVEQSDIIITATTSETPVLPNRSTIYNGKLIIGIGSFQPHMRELPDELFKEASSIFIDTQDASFESGDIIDPIQNEWINESQVMPFSQVITNKIKPMIDPEKPTIFKSTGSALFDVVTAETIYYKAIQKGIGQKIAL